MSSHSAVVTEETQIKCNRPAILAAIRKDNLDDFCAVFDIEEPNERLECSGSDCPWILNGKPFLLQLCAFFCAKECFKFLQLQDADQTQTDDQGRSLLHFAAAGGDMDIVRALDVNKVKVNARDTDGCYPSHYAAKFSKFDVFQWLWTHGSSLDAPNHRGATPFMWACGNGNIELMKFLLEHGDASAAEETDGGWTPVHYAAAKGQIESLEVLLEQDRFDINARTRWGKSPLDVASDNEESDSVSWLLEHGARKGARKRKKYDDW